jgi:hypothetical protein
MASWNHDGTQDPGPPPLMSDPLSGLVTGGRYDGEAVRIRVVEPAKPDIEAVREAMESVLDENSELRVDLVAPKPASRPAPAKEAEPAAQTPPPTPPVGIPAAAPRIGLTPAEIPAQRVVRPPRRRWSPGLAGVALLLLVMAVLAIVMLASLIDTISSIFS